MDLTHVSWHRPASMHQETAIRYSVILKLRTVVQDHQEAAILDTMARPRLMALVAQDVRLVLRESSRLHQAMERRTLYVLLVLAASIRAALRRPVWTKQPHVPLVQQDMAVLAVLVVLRIRSARLRLIRAHV